MTVQDTAINHNNAKNSIPMLERRQVFMETAFSPAAPDEKILLKEPWSSFLSRG